MIGVVGCVKTENDLARRSDAMNNFSSRLKDNRFHSFSLCTYIFSELSSETKFQIDNYQDDWTKKFFQAHIYLYYWNYHLQCTKTSRTNLLVYSVL